MKLKKIVCAAVAAVTSMQCNYAANAAELTAKLSYSAQKSEITVSGSAEDSVVLLILPEGKTPAEADDDSEKVYFDVISPSDGAYTFGNIRLSEKTPTGNYAAYVTSADSAEAELAFHFVSMKDARSIAEILNNAEDSETLQNAVEANSAFFDIDANDEKYKAAAEETYKIFEKIKSKYNNENAGAVYDEFHAALAMAYIEKSDRTALESVILQRDANLGIDYNTDYADGRLSENAKKELAALLAETVFSEEITKSGRQMSFSEILIQKKILAAVKTAASWQQLKQVLMEDFKKECESFTDDSDFKSLKNSDAVFSEMMSGEYASFGDIEKCFQNAVSTVKNRSTSGGSSSGGSGSGGGSGSSMSYRQPTQTAEKTFADLTAQHWAYEKIQTLCTKNIVQGYPDNTFRPDNYVTRAEFVKMLITAAGISAGGNAEFKDVLPDSWFYAWVAAAAEKRIVLGDTDGNFRPNDPVSRQDAAVILERTLQSCGKALSDGTCGFHDNDDISDYAKKSIGRLFASGIVTGDESNLFNPSAVTKRSEAVSMIYNAFYK